MNKNKQQYHYDLNFLNIGERWRTEHDNNRLQAYRYAKAQFEMTPEDGLRELLPDGLLSLASYEDFVNCTRLLGYPRLLTLKTVDMIIGQPPVITCKTDDSITDHIRQIRVTSGLSKAMKQALIDYSRFGVFLIRVFKDEKGKGHVTAWDPGEWTPVFYADGTNRIRYNVIGWCYGNTLTVQIHSTEDGSYEERVCIVDDTGVIKEIKSSRRYNTTSGKKLLFAVVNTPTTTNPLGTNDYEIINGLLQKAIQRLQAILKVLDEHAEPSMTGPHSLLSTDEYGQVVFKTNKYYAVGQDEQKPEYIVWKAELESSFRAFEELCKQIYILSEMGEAFLGASGGTGNVVSGTALRFKMISPLGKARRVANDLTEPFKEVISTLLYLEGLDVPVDDISIVWKENLPKDPREVAELARLEAGAPAVKPLDNALMDNYDMDQESAKKFVEDILREQEQFRLAKDDPINPQDGRSHGPEGTIDIRKQGSILDPASSENRGEDSKK